MEETPAGGDPLGGGLAVWTATWSGCAIGRLGIGSWAGEDGDAGWYLAGLAIASLLVLGVGLIDDRRGMRARYKLAGQAVAAAILAGFGLRIDTWGCFGFEVELGIFAYPATVFWIVLVINAYNLVDGMDGFCGSLGLVAALAIAFLAWWSGRAEDAVVALALAGALVAFLTDNLPPAKVYLGDSGSMTHRDPDRRPLDPDLLRRAWYLGLDCADGLAGELPLLDLATAIVRRSLAGHSIFAPDRGHLHHRLGSRLGSTHAALGAAACLAIPGAGGAALVKAPSWGTVRRAWPSSSRSACSCAPILSGGPSRGSCGSGSTRRWSRP